jgi:hypothetical protein
VVPGLRLTRSSVGCGAPTGLSWSCRSLDGIADRRSHRAVAEQPISPIDRAVEVLLYAPLGLVLSAKEDLPALVAKGRHAVAAQLTVARMVGRLAVKHGTREAERVVSQAAALLGVLGGPTSAPPAHTPSEPVAPRPPPRSSSNGNGAHPGGPIDDAPTESQLAIPGYDSLSAPQVVRRLDGLVGGELDAVRRYEEAHRGRRTILSKIAQLQAESA